MVIGKNETAATCAKSSEGVLGSKLSAGERARIAVRRAVLLSAKNVAEAPMPHASDNQKEASASGQTTGESVLMARAATTATERRLIEMVLAAIRQTIMVVAENAVPSRNSRTIRTGWGTARAWHPHNHAEGATTKTHRERRKAFFLHRASQRFPNAQATKPMQAMPAE